MEYDGGKALLIRRNGWGLELKDVVPLLTDKIDVVNEKRLPKINLDKYTHFINWGLVEHDSPKATLNRREISSAASLEIQLLVSLRYLSL